MHKVQISDDIIDRVVERRGRFHLYDQLDPSRTAFVVIDMQNAFCKPSAPVEVPLSRDIVPNINRLAGELRKLGGDVVWVTSEFNHWGGKTDWEKGHRETGRATARVGSGTPETGGSLCSVTAACAVLLRVCVPVTG